MKRDALFALSLALALIACVRPAPTTTQHVAAPPPSSTATRAPTTDAGPPLTDGFYVVPNACPGEGCELGAWIATKPGELREQADEAAPVVAQIAPGENVDAIESVLRLKPVRGVVFRADDTLAVGDVIYLLDAQGEGEFNLWRRGETLSWTWPSENAGSVDESTGVHWDRAEADWATNAPRGPLEGWWVKLRTTHGATGWARADGYECRPVPEHPEHCQLM